MADASLGGKNGINTSFGKNLIGTIHHPKAIWMDLALLNTLPQQEYLSGLAEIIKMGLIADASLIERIEQKGFDPHNHSELAYLIQRAAELKIQIIEEDPEERSIRAILNFGHTVAHAIEQASNYTIPHGLAVALGCIAESYLSYHLDHLALLDAERIERLITTLGFPFMKLPVNLKASMHSDKKNQGGQIHFVLLKSLGNTYSSHGRFTHPVSDEAIDAMLAWLSQRTEKL
jgi:3-dehydroquinate synthase